MRTRGKNSMEQSTTTTITISLIVVSLATMIVLATTMMEVNALKVHAGNNGQCKQLQKQLPPDLQDFEGCHSTFTGKGHKMPEPLP